MTTWLVAAWEEREVDEQSAGIVRGAQGGASVVVWHVVVEEDVLEVVEDRDTVGGDGDGVDGRDGDRVRVADDLADARERAGVLLWDADTHDTGDVVARGLRDLRNLAHVGVNIDHLGHSVPVAPLLGVTRVDDATGSGRRRLDVPGGSESDEHVLDGPLQLGKEQLKCTILSDAGALFTVHTDKGETNAFDENVMTWIPASPRNFLRGLLAPSLLKGRHPLGWD